jgi:hypothetical protein
MMIAKKVCFRAAILFLFAAALLVACSSTTPYRSDVEKNLRIQVKASSGSMFQKLNVGLHIYDVDPKCQLVYRGTVKLDGSSVDVGLPVNRQMYLEFYFAKSAVFYSSSSSVTYGMLLQPRAAHEYVADASYLDDLYKVQLREKSRGSASGRVIERRALETCVSH